MCSSLPPDRENCSCNAGKPAASMLQPHSSLTTPQGVLLLLYYLNTYLQLLPCVQARHLASRALLGASNPCPYPVVLKGSACHFGTAGLTATCDAGYPCGKGALTCVTGAELFPGVNNNQGCRGESLLLPQIMSVVAMHAVSPVSSD